MKTRFPRTTFRHGCMGSSLTLACCLSLSVSNDASFSTSWSRTGDTFAVASQDGVVTIFDRRRLLPMKTFQTHQRGSSGAARVVKYSQGPHELMAFSEQKNYIHVVDARTYEYSERIYLPGVVLQDHDRTGHIITHAALYNDLAAHPLLGGERSTGGVSINSSSGRPHLWDRQPRAGSMAHDSTVLSTAMHAANLSAWETMPADDASQLSQALQYWQDCPPTAASPLPFSSSNPWLTSSVRPSTARSTLLLTSSLRRNRDEVLASFLSSARPSPTSANTATPSTRGAPSGNRTVSQILGGLEGIQPDTSTETSAPNLGTGSTAITGLDWDPSGQYL